MDSPMCRSTQCKWVISAAGPPQGGDSTPSGGGERSERGGYLLWMRFLMQRRVIHPALRKRLAWGGEQRVNHIVLKHTSQRKVQTMHPHHPKKIQAQLETIARDHLFIQTLEIQMSDRLDFHEVSVWMLKSALEAAYEAGRAAAMFDTAMPKQTKRN